MNSAKPRAERFGYLLKTVLAISHRPIERRCRMVRYSSAGSNRAPVSCSTSRSISPTSLSACLSRPWMNSQRGLSGTLGRTGPVGAVDDDVDAPAVLLRDQLVDGRVDGRVLTADAEAGHEPEQKEPPRGERQRGHRRGGQVHRKGDHEELLPAEPVGQPAEEQRTDAGAE